MAAMSRRGGITHDQHSRGRLCYAQVIPDSGGLPARRCHRKARVDYVYQEHTAPLCAQHARMLERWIEGSSIDFAITMLVRWSDL